MNNDLLRTFIVIAECGNLTQAASRLNRTQSAVSVQLRKLEEALRVTLFERGARGMRLSPAGEQLLPAARRTLVEFERTARLFETPLSGRLRIGIPDDYDDTVFEVALADFSNRNPGVEIVVESGCTSAFAVAVEGGRLDVAICSAPESVPGEPLLSEPTVWVAGDRMVLSQSEDVPIALLDRGCPWCRLPTEALKRAGRGWRVAYTSQSFSSLRSAIRAGLAVGVLPLRCVEPGMRILSSAEGFPELPASNRAILVGGAARSDLAGAMAEAIRRAVRGRS
ncbi:LysR substrate-binding domain-containing protein [Nisaea sp.]|uniref:LysR family transcriptional regulator n=1 Tax=Nisaea sp. TaxID=2024842 RepID=UPI0032997D54